MRFGDLSNRPAPRVYVVWEGCVAEIPKGNADEYARLTTARKTDWYKAMKCWVVNKLMAAKINHLAWSKDVNFTVVSWLPQDAFYGIDVLMEESGIIAGIQMSDPDALAKEVSAREDVLCVYDPIPEHILKFGSKGYVITGPNDLGRML
jgi:hypothetical protein